MFGKVRRALFHVDHLSGLDEGVIWILLSSVQSDALIVVEATSELIAVYDSEHTAVNVQVETEIEIFPWIWLLGVFWHGNLVAFQKYTLGNTSVLNLVFDDVKRVIIEVVVHSALSDTVVLVGVFDHWLLEVGFELQDLSRTKRSYNRNYVPEI